MKYKYLLIIIIVLIILYGIFFITLSDSNSFESHVSEKYIFGTADNIEFENSDFEKINFTYPVLTILDTRNHTKLVDFDKSILLFDNELNYSNSVKMTFDLTTYNIDENDLEEIGLRLIISHDDPTFDMVLAEENISYITNGTRKFTVQVSDIVSTQDVLDKGVELQINTKGNDILISNIGISLLARPY